jgi:hypothetical protein
VALVESSFRTLASIDSVGDEMLELGFVRGYRDYGVDWDLVSCLEEATIADTSYVPTSETAPVLVPGRAW